MNDLAPIVLFVYNRIDHTKKTIEALQRNILANESELYIFSDGARTGDEEKVKEVRKYIKHISGFRNVQIKEREENWGLAKSVIAGTTEIIKKYNRVIVLEDDIICAPDFLKFMNWGLDKYQDEPKVFEVTGYSYLIEEEKKGIRDTYFSHLPSSWSWGTWQNRWEHFDEYAAGYERLIWNLKLRKKFNYDNAYDYYTMLMSQMGRRSLASIKLWRKKKPIDSWAIRWYWAIFKHGGLTVHPKDSLIENIGFDGSGTHCGVSTKWNKIGSLNEDMQYEDTIEEQKWIRDKIRRSIKK